MENPDQIIDEVAKQHFSHLTPGTPDHFTFARFIADLKARLNPSKQPDQPTIHEEGA